MSLYFTNIFHQDTDKHSWHLRLFSFSSKQGWLLPIVLPYAYPENFLALNYLIKTCFNLVARISPDGWKCFPLRQPLSSLSNTFICVTWKYIKISYNLCPSALPHTATICMCYDKKIEVRKHPFLYLCCFHTPDRASFLFSSLPHTRVTPKATLSVCSSPNADMRATWKGELNQMTSRVFSVLFSFCEKD